MHALLLWEVYVEYISSTVQYAKLCRMSDNIVFSGYLCSGMF